MNYNSMWYKAKKAHEQFINGGKFIPKLPQTVSDWLKKVAEKQAEILSLQKKFSFQRFQDVDSLIWSEDGGFNKYKCFRILNAERKIEIIKENTTSFNLDCQGVFFSVTKKGALKGYSNSIAAIMAFKLSYSPDSVRESLIIGLTREGKWLYIKTFFQNTSEKKRYSISSKSGYNNFKKISLTVKEVTLEELATMLSRPYCSRYAPPYGEHCEIKETMQMLQLIHNALNLHIIALYKKTQNRLAVIEEVLRKNVLEEIIRYSDNHLNRDMRNQYDYLY